MTEKCAKALFYIKHTINVTARHHTEHCDDWYSQWVGCYIWYSRWTWVGGRSSSLYPSFDVAASMSLYRRGSNVVKKSMRRKIRTSHVITTSTTADVIKWNKLVDRSADNTE